MVLKSSYRAVLSRSLSLASVVVLFYFRQAAWSVGSFPWSGSLLRVRRCSAAAPLHSLSSGLRSAKLPALCGCRLLSGVWRGHVCVTLAGITRWLLRPSAARGAGEGPAIGHGLGMLLARGFRARVAADPEAHRPCHPADVTLAACQACISMSSFPRQC